MTRLRIMVLVAVAAVLCAHSAEAKRPARAKKASGETSMTLREAAERRGLLLGAAVAAGPLADEPRYGQVLAEQFNLVTTENVLKFGPVHPEPDRYDFVAGDRIVDFAHKHGMKVRGHTLVWHRQQPKWVTTATLPREEIELVLRDHIRKVVGRYRGRIAVWDVVNEAVTDDGKGLRDNVWLRGIGPGYIEKAFRWAHEADPKAKLHYNEYGAEGMNPKSDAVYELVRRLKSQGVPIHGVGMQMHLGLKDRRDPRDVARNIERLAALGLDVDITEMDVRILDSTAPLQQRLDEQAKVYADMLDMCLRTRGCNAFILWGFTDKHSWIRHPEQVLIFDREYRPKPAYHSMLKVLQEEAGKQRPKPRQ